MNTQGFDCRTNNVSWIWGLGMLIALFGTAALAGCSNDPGRTRAKGAVTSLADTRDEIIDARRKVSATLTDLRTFQKDNADLKKSFDTYKTDVADLESQRDDVRERLADMNERAVEYRTQWQADTMGLRDPNLRGSAQDRAKMVGDRYDQISASATEVRNEYAPYVAELGELQTYLSNDLTRPSINAAGPTFEKTINQGELLNRKLDVLLDQLNTLAAAITPTGQPPQ